MLSLQLFQVYFSFLEQINTTTGTMMEQVDDTLSSIPEKKDRQSLQPVNLALCLHRLTLGLYQLSSPMSKFSSWVTSCLPLPEGTTQIYYTDATMLTGLSYKQEIA